MFFSPQHCHGTDLQVQLKALCLSWQNCGGQLPRAADLIKREAELLQKLEDLRFNICLHLGDAAMEWQCAMVHGHG